MKPLLFAMLLATLMLVAQARPAIAIPPYARQLGVDCTQCHTMWPRLNTFGRQFKIKGYVDRSPLGNTDIPFALRIKADYEANTAVTPFQAVPPVSFWSGTPSAVPTAQLYSKGTDKHVNFPAEAMFFWGQPLLKNLGLFFQMTGSEASGVGVVPRNFSTTLDTVRLAYNLSMEHPASITVFKGDMFGADPYPSLGGMGFSPFSNDGAAQPAFLAVGGPLLAPLDGSKNYGVVIHGYLDKHNSIYGAFGAETGSDAPDSGNISPVTISHFQQAPKWYGRLAYEHPIGDNGGVWNLGVCYIGGRESINSPDTSQVTNYNAPLSRLYIDGAVQLPDSHNNMFELIGLYGTGWDKHVIEFDPTNLNAIGNPIANPPVNVHVGGYFLQSDYYFKGKWGPQISYDHSQLGATSFNTLGIGVAWLAQRDMKIGLNGFFTTGSDGSSSRTIGLYIHKYFYAPIEQVQKMEKKQREQKKEEEKKKKEHPAGDSDKKDSDKKEEPKPAPSPAPPQSQPTPHSERPIDSAWRVPLG